MTALSNISCTVMTYLETRRTADAYRRTLRMNTGVGSFIEGHGSLAGWQDGPNRAAFADDHGQEGTLNKPQQSLQYEQRNPGIDASTGPPSRQTATSSSTDNSNMWTPATSASPLPNTNTTQDYFGPAAAASGGHRARPHSPTPGSGPHDLPSPLPTLLPGHDHVFARASNLVREAIEVEGCFFLDAQRSLSSSSSLGSSHAGSQSPSGADKNQQKSQSPRGRNGISDSSSSGSGSEDAGSVNTRCKVLGFSTSEVASVDGPSSHHAPLLVHEALLTRLLRRYPAGKIFNFDAAGELQSSDSGDEPTSVPAQPRPRRRKLGTSRREASMILEAFPGARSVAFFPLRNHKTERWFAGGFAYTHNPKRIFNPAEELVYLRAFGMLVMSEIHRGEILETQKAKDDVLNSISHELRSPLHGVVLGVELLQDTALDAFQGALLHSVDTCGRTLLDTIDHLLDFTKINNYTRMSAENRKLNKNSRGAAVKDVVPSTLSPNDIRSHLAVVDLDAITEEVVESVYIGHTHQITTMGESMTRTRRPREGAGHNKSRPLNDDMFDPKASGASTEDRRVAVSLHIEPGCNWSFQTQPGAFRRLLMNLFSNALKYTPNGSVKVFLTQRADGDPASGRKKVTMTVVDTGIGIGDDFMRNDLFKPFSQETTLSTGTGLGLSIVKQIASSLGGRVKVDSARGVGTTASVTMPLMQASPADGGKTSEDDVPLDPKSFAANVRELRGLRALIVGYGDVLPPTLRESQDLEGIEVVCSKWLQMTMIRLQQVDDGVVPDVVICSRAAMPQFQTRQVRSPACVVVCSSALEAYALSSSNESHASSGTYEFISAPLGPRKLATVLLLAYQRWQAQQSSSLDLVLARGELSLPIRSPQVEEKPVEPATTSAADQAAPEDCRKGKISPAAARPTTPPARFLLVDDNAINLKILSAYVDKLGLDFVTAVNGKEAVDIYCSNPNEFVCIFMDISMPVMDGFEATRAIRAFEREKSLPGTFILALSGLASEGAQQEAQTSGITTFLAKPVKLKELKAVLAAEGLIET